MSKRKRKAKNNLDGYFEAALLRAANGKATLRDIGFLDRMMREGKGIHGYTGEPRTSMVKASYKPITQEPGESWASFTARKRREEADMDHTEWGRGWGGHFSEGYRHYGGSTIYSPSSSHSQGGGERKSGDPHVFCAESNEVIKACPIASQPEIMVDAKVWQQWIELAKAVDTEWMALLSGSVSTGDKGQTVYTITKYYFPPQTAGGAHVDVPTGYRPNKGIIGAVHSHVKMGVFFSETDKQHSNWPVEIVVNARDEYAAMARHKLKCGEWAKHDAKVYLSGTLLSGKVLDTLKQAFAAGKAWKAGSLTLPPTLAKEDKEDAQKALPLAPSTPSAPQATSTAIVPAKDDPTVQESPDDICFDCDHPRKDHGEGGCAVLTKVEGTPANTHSFCDCDEFISQEEGEEYEAELKANERLDLPSEELCQTCEGEGGNLVQGLCKDCKGDGLSDIGRQKAKDREAAAKMEKDLAAEASGFRVI